MLNEHHRELNHTHHKYIQYMFGLLLLTMFFQTSHAQSPPFEWVLRVGGTSTEVLRDIVVDGYSNIYVCGDFRSDSFNIGPYQLTNSEGHPNAFLLKMGPGGETQWVKTVTSNLWDLGNVCAVDKDQNVYFAGTFDGATLTVESLFGPVVLNNPSMPPNPKPAIFLVKYDTNGQILWATTVESESNVLVSGAVCDSNGACYLTGSFYGDSIVFESNVLYNTDSSGTSDIFIVKYDPMGSMVWGRSVVGTHYDYSEAITIDSNDNIYFTGSFLSQLITFDNITLTNVSSGYPTLFLAKYSIDGDVTWVRSAGVYVEGADVATDDIGNIYVSGSFSGLFADFGSQTVTNSESFSTRDLFAVRYDGDGNDLWAFSAGGNLDRDESIECMSVMKNGNIFTGGYFVGSLFDYGSIMLSNANGLPYSELFISAHDSLGNVVWATQAFGDRWDIVQAMNVDVDGNLYALGRFDSKSTAFNGYTLYNADTSGGTYDGFIAKMATVTGIEESVNDNNGVRFWPNPTDGVLNVSNPTEDQYNLSIFNAVGQVHYKGALSPKTSLTINLSWLQSGLYYLSSGNAGSATTYKFIIR